MPSFGISQDSSSSKEVTTSEYETNQEPEEEALLIMSTSQAPMTPVIVERTDGRQQQRLGGR